MESLVKSSITFILLSAFASLLWAQSDAQLVRIQEPQNGAIVSSPFKVKFDVKGKKVAPAGTQDPNTGHHHLLINKGSLELGEEVPFDKVHLHFGKGQTESEVNLPPGKYRLTAQFADGEHRSFGSRYSHTIEITVQ